MFEIVQAGNPVLRQVARPLSLEEIASEEIQVLIEWMVERMREAPGVGLAAPQVGVSLRLLVIEDRPEYIARISEVARQMREREPVPLQVLINPVLTVVEPGPAVFFEGCLSIPGYQGQVGRARAVEVQALDAQGQPVTIQARGWYARILQHEIDHLDGVLCVDRMDLRTLTTHQNYQQFWQTGAT